VLELLILLNKLTVSALESFLIFDGFVTIFATLLPESCLIPEHLRQKLRIKSYSLHFFGNFLLELLSLLKQWLQFQLQIVLGIFKLTVLEFEFLEHCAEFFKSLLKILISLSQIIHLLLQIVNFLSLTLLICFVVSRVHFSSLHPFLVCFEHLHLSMNILKLLSQSLLNTVILDPSMTIAIFEDQEVLFDK